MSTIEDLPDDSQPELAYETPEVDRSTTSSPTETELEQEMAGEGGHDPYAALRYADYRRYAIGGMLNALGSQMRNVAIGWEIYERTHSTLALGMVGLVQAAPVIGLALPAGQLADRINRKTLMLSTQVGLALCSLALALISRTHGHVSWVYAVLLTSGVFGAIGNPAAQALLPQLVPKAVFNNAVTWNSTRWQIASTVGPALGGFIIAWSNSAVPAYILDAASTVIFFFFVLGIKSKQQPRREEPVTWSSLMGGARFVWRHDLILSTITLDMFAVLFGGATALLPVYAKDILHVGPQGLGWLRAAPSCGAIFMALALAHMPPMRRAGKAMLWSVVGFGMATIGFGISRNFYVSCALLAITGALDNISVVIRHTLVQVTTPDYMRGRVSAINSVFIGTSNEVGEFESGLVAHLVGSVGSVVAGGIGTILTVAAVAHFWPQVRRLGSLNDLKVADPDALEAAAVA